jgi:hypothetical protein
VRTKIIVDWGKLLRGGEGTQWTVVAYEKKKKKKKKGREEGKE